MNESVLFVDDELNVLNAYKRALRKQFKLHLAASGREALQLLADGGRYAVIVSDMRMPEMNGVELLARFRQQSPDTVRIMLTGNSDQETAVAAVNDGDVFRFLNKPCPPQELAEAINSGLERYRITVAEKELLEQTVKGSLNALSEVLSLLSPEDFGSSASTTKTMCAVVAALKMEPEWWFEPLARLSRVGWVALPEKLRTKVAQGVSLEEEELALFRKYPAVGAELLSRIPRLEALAEAIRFQEKHYDGGGFPEGGAKGEEIPFGARLLKVVQDYDRALSAGLDTTEALGRLHWNRRQYDPRILEALERVVGMPAEERVHEIDVLSLADGMVLHQDVTTVDGRLLVRKGQQVTPTVRQLVYNFWANRNVRLPILVTLPAGIE